MYWSRFVLGSSCCSCQSHTVCANPSGTSASVRKWVSIHPVAPAIGMSASSRASPTRDQPPIQSRTFSFKDAIAPNSPGNNLEHFSSIPLRHRSWANGHLPTWAIATSETSGHLLPRGCSSQVATFQLPSRSASVHSGWACQWAAKSDCQFGRIAIGGCTCWRRVSKRLCWRYDQSASDSGVPAPAICGGYFPRPGQRVSNDAFTRISTGNSATSFRRNCSTASGANGNARTGRSVRASTSHWVTCSTNADGIVSVDATSTGGRFHFKGTSTNGISPLCQSALRSASSGSC